MLWRQAEPGQTAEPRASPQRPTKPCCVGCLAIAVAAGALALFLAFSMLRPAMWEASCGANLRQVGIAMLMYAQENDGGLPDAHRWRDQLVAYTNSHEVMRRKMRTASRDSVGYAAIVF